LHDKKNPNSDNIVKDWIKNKNKSQFKDIITDEHIVQYKMLSYNVNYLNTTIQVENNLTQVKHLATGFMMFQRNVITSLSKAFPSTKYTDDVSFLKPEENKWAYALFDCGVEDGRYMSEDWLFCSRWRKIGGEIYIDITIDLAHTGIEKYKGSYITSIMV
jgi:hypothetical protein